VAADWRAAVPEGRARREAAAYQSLSLPLRANAQQLVAFVQTPDAFMDAFGAC